MAIQQKAKGSFESWKDGLIKGLRKLNPQAVILRPGQTLLYCKGAVQRVIVGWQAVTIQSVAKLYNGSGDEKYAKKLDFAFDLVKRGKGAVCD